MNKYIKPDSVKIVYFSGTGGTRRVADGFAIAFEDRKIVVKKYELKKPETIDTVNEDILILIFPVHAFNAPKPIYEYIKSLTAVEGIPAVVISISGGGEITPNTASRTHCIKKLEKKGYDVVYEEMLIMPSNFAVPTPDGLSIRLLEILPQKIDKIVSDLISTVRHRTKPNLLNKVMSSLGEAEKSSLASRWFAKQIKANDNCTGCGKCANSCPRVNIKMENNVPVFGTDCVMCLKCIYGCPTHALITKSAKFIVLKQGYDLDEIERRMSGVQLATIEELTKDNAFIAIKKYLLD